MLSTYDFASIGYSERDSEMLSNGAAAVTAAEAWDWMANFNEESFMFSQDPMIQRITDKMGDYAGHHSGASFGMTMRVMEYIAKHGWENFMLKMTPGASEADKKRLRIAELPYAIEEAKNELDAWKIRNEQVDLTSEHAAETKSNMAKRIDESTAKVALLEHDLACLIGHN